MKQNELGGLMFVDSDLLRCGAEFSRSAGTIAQDGAHRFSATSVRARIFGDFAEAEDFHRALARAHENNATAMHGHQATLNALAEKVHTAAAIFVKEDEQHAAELNEAKRQLE